MRGLKSHLSRAASAALCLALSVGIAASARAEERKGFLETIKRHSVLTSTITPNGDQNPYAVVVAPVTAGKVQKDDVLVTNFNNSGNLQGLGTTIVSYNPSTKHLSVFAALPRHLAQCPGGIGLTTAMTMLKSGWVIVGSLPSQDGTTATKGDGCLLVLDPNGNVAKVMTGPHINGPWGNMAVIDNGDNATLFVSNTGFRRHRTRPGRRLQGQCPADRADDPARTAARHEARDRDR